MNSNANTDHLCSLLDTVASGLEIRGTLALL